MPIPHAELERLHQTSGFVELYTLDATEITGGLYRFTNTPSASGGPLVFGGFSYDPLPIATDGWDLSSSGSLPKPTLSISNTYRTLLAEVVNLGDLVGAKLTRIRTYAKFLDDQPTADSSQMIGPEVYIIEQKTAHNRDFIQWQMTSILDRFGMQLPRRQILKDKGFPGVSRVRVPG